MMVKQTIMIQMWKICLVAYQTTSLKCTQFVFFFKYKWFHYNFQFFFFYLFPISLNFTMILQLTLFLKQSHLYNLRCKYLFLSTLITSLLIRLINQSIFLIFLSFFFFTFSQQWIFITWFSFYHTNSLLFFRISFTPIFSGDALLWDKFTFPMSFLLSMVNEFCVLNFCTFGQAHSKY